MAEFRGYTGKPLYSVWFGSETEQRAVFVDEIKCVGCLKCALFAEKTFAVESVYGRARVVAQWADPEHKIHDAIQSCPVDCISCDISLSLSQNSLKQVLLCLAMVMEFKTNFMNPQNPELVSIISVIRGTRSIHY